MVLSAQTVKENFLWIAEHTFTKLPWERSTIKSVALAGDLFDGIFGINLGVVGNLAAGYDKFIYLPETIKKGDKLLQKAVSVGSDFKAGSGKTWKEAGARTKELITPSIGFFGSACASGSFFVLMGVSYLKPHSTLLKATKNVCSLYSVVVTTWKEGNNMKDNWSPSEEEVNGSDEEAKQALAKERKKELVSSGFKIASALGCSLPLNLFGFIKTVFPTELNAKIAAGSPGLPKWSFQLLRGVGCAGGIAGSYINAK